MPLHSTLTGSDLHESKGVASASANTVYVNNGAGSGTHQKLTSDSIADGHLPGVVFLASGTGTSAATLDIVLSSYSAYGFKAYNVVLANILPATDGVDLWCRLSTNGGSSYLATGYNYVFWENADIGSGHVTQISASANQILMSSGDSTVQVGNASVEGWAGTVELYNPAATALWPRILFRGYAITEHASQAGLLVTGGGALELAQDTDAIRLMFSSGNIAFYSYSLHGVR